MRQLERHAMLRSHAVQCHALLELAESEMSLSGLAAALDLDPSTLSRTVDGLVAPAL